MLQIFSKYLLALLICCSTGLLEAQTTFPPLAIEEREDPCHLPPPDRFIVTCAGATWINVRWSSVPAAGGYRIKVYKTINQQLVANILILDPSTTQYLIGGLESGVSYDIHINATNPMYVDCPLEIYIITTTVSIELSEVNYFYPSFPGPPSCVLPASPSCSFPNTVGDYTEFMITSTGSHPQSRRFRIGRPNPDNQFKFEVKSVDENNSNLFVFACSNGQLPTCTTGEVYIYIKTNPIPIARLQISNCTYKANLEGYDIAQGFEIQKVEPTLAAKSSNLEAEFALNTTLERTGSESIPQITAFPSPFTNLLQVNLAEPILEPTNLKLLDLSGLTVQSQAIQAGQKNAFFNTAELPSGLYMLCLQSKGKVQTCRIFKAN